MFLPVSVVLEAVLTEGTHNPALHAQARNSVCHSAAIFANAIMHSGTTVDAFLRENLEWLSRATNWAKFSATAGLGVIHRGHLSQARALSSCAAHKQPVYLDVRGISLSELTASYA